MKMFLNRTRTRQDSTDGMLIAQNGERICDTAEYTPTRLPAGTYRVTLKNHPRKKHRAPYLQLIDESRKVNGFIIEGNGVLAKGFGTTIIVGDHLVTGVVIRSRPYLNQIVKRLEKAFMRNQEVELIIR